MGSKVTGDGLGGVVEVLSSSSESKQMISIGWLGLVMTGVGVGLHTSIGGGTGNIGGGVGVARIPGTELQKARGGTSVHVTLHTIIV